jgi:hypothetical protein
MKVTPWIATSRLEDILETYDWTWAKMDQVKIFQTPEIWCRTMQTVLKLLVELPVCTCHNTVKFSPSAKGLHVEWPYQQCRFAKAMDWVVHRCSKKVAEQFSNDNIGWGMACVVAMFAAWILPFSLGQQEYDLNDTPSSREYSPQWMETIASWWCRWHYQHCEWIVPLLWRHLQGNV